MVDLLDYDTVKKAIADIAPDIIIHSARLGEFDDDPVKAKEVTANLVSSIKSVSARLIYMSSDAVFDGTKGEYKEDSRGNPVTDYGRAKLAAENVIKSEMDNYTIIRAGYIYGVGAKGMDRRCEKILAETKDGKKVKRFNDVFRTPIHVTKLAKFIWKLVGSDFKGIIHVGEEKQSVYQFSQKILKDAGADSSLVESDSARDKGLNIAIDTSLNTKLYHTLIK